MNSVQKLIQYTLIILFITTQSCSGEGGGIVKEEKPTENTEPNKGPKPMLQSSAKILEYLQSVYGTRPIGAMRGIAQASTLAQTVGKYPAFVEEDLCGWRAERWSSEYAARVQSHIDEVKEIWYTRKAIPGLCWHWANPLRSGGNFADSQVKLTDEQWDRIITKGTPEYTAMMTDLKKHADYLEQLTNLNIPLIWRPLHEIDGGWFWWTSKEKPERTVALWKIMYEYFVTVRGFNNLIWVYCAGEGNPSKVTTEYRKKFYPGDAYCHMAGIDLYKMDYQNSGTRTYYDATLSYKQAYDTMTEVCPGKMLILTECDAMPNVEKTMSNDPNFAKWLWAMPWYCNNENNPKEWVATTYQNSNIIMQPELPVWPR